MMKLMNNKIQNKLNVDETFSSDLLAKTIAVESVGVDADTDNNNGGGGGDNVDYITTNSSGFKRSISIRKSLRLLGNTNRNNGKSNSVVQFKIPLTLPITTLKSNKKIISNFSEASDSELECDNQTIISSNIPPKAVSVLLNNPLKTSDNKSETLNKLKNSENQKNKLKFLHRSNSLKHESLAMTNSISSSSTLSDQSAIKTATIRRNSVWANSNTKINLPEITKQIPIRTNNKYNQHHLYHYFHHHPYDYYDELYNTSKLVKSSGKKKKKMSMEFLVPHLPPQSINRQGPQQTKTLTSSETGNHGDEVILRERFSNLSSFTNNISTSNKINVNNTENGNSAADIVRFSYMKNNQQTNNNYQHQNKMSKKQLKLAQAQLNKLTQTNIHLHALFSAVENGHLEKARTILESTDVDVNSSNSDGLSPLDVAVLSNNRSMTKMLLEHGAMEGSKDNNNPDALGKHLNILLCDAENRIQELGIAEDNPQIPFNTRASFSSIIGNTGTSVTGCTGSEVDKQIGIWERRVKGLKRMLLGWDQARPPDPPNKITINVTGINAITIRVQESNEGAISTKFKIQWSSRMDFSNIVGERELNEWHSFQGSMGTVCNIQELTQGRRYFFRACCGNVKGWGQYQHSIPASVIPSSWRDIENREQRYFGRQRILDELFTAVRLARPDDASEIQLDTPALQRRNPRKKTTIKQLFSAASKFQKNLRRGIYLACIIYNEDKVLVTNEDFLPVIEIDESYPSCLHTDFHWLMKVACTWEDVKLLRNDMEKNSTSAIHFRTKLLSAVCQMQSALCIQDIGQLYHKPLKDSQGTVVLTCINSVKGPKSISVLNSRWINLNKIQKKIICSLSMEDNNINDILINSIQDQINYHQSSSVRLSPGLYLGYLKLHSSVEQIQVVVPSKTPNVLPHCKIRDNSHISAEEWDILKSNKLPISTTQSNSGENLPSSTSCLFDMNKKQIPCDSKANINSIKQSSNTSSATKMIKDDNFSSNNSSLNKPNELQELFLDALTYAIQRLFRYMDITFNDTLTHRLYDIEVIELSYDVSFLIVCPRAESSCAVPGQREILLQRSDLISLSIQAFEMIHFKTYQNAIIQKYSRLSCILELDTILANHSHREAFSSVELKTAKDRLTKLNELTNNLNCVWKGVRWLMDVISFARDRCSYLGINIKDILNFDLLTDEQQQQHKHITNLLVKTDNACNKRYLLQPPTSNASISSASAAAATTTVIDRNSSILISTIAQNDNKLMKSSPGRGSWPGPTNQLNSSTDLLNTIEHSKSEQQLYGAGHHHNHHHHHHQNQQYQYHNLHYNHQYQQQHKESQQQQEDRNQESNCDIVQTQHRNEMILDDDGNEVNIRKNSADSNYSQSCQSYYSAGDSYEHIKIIDSAISGRLPPSRSEDTLIIKHHSGHISNVSNLKSSHYRKRATTINASLSAVSSPLLNMRSSFPSQPTATTAFTDSVQSLSSDSESGSMCISNLAVTTGASRSGSAIHGKSSGGSVGGLISISSGNSSGHSSDNSYPLTAKISTTYNFKPLEQYNSKSLSSIKIDSYSDSGDMIKSKRQFFESDSQNRPPTTSTSTYSPSITSPIQSVSNVKTTINSTYSLQTDGKIYKETLFISETEKVPLSDTIHQINKKLPETLVNKNRKNDVITCSSASSSSTITFTTATASASTSTSSSSSSSTSSAGIIQVYAAYETGLANGTSLKLHVTNKTSTREVIDLVVKQLNMAVVLKGKDGPIYTPDKLENFCLVAVIGARERCLRDDFKLLQLQNPWKKGRLYVRLKHDLLAAIEHSNRDAQLI